MQPPIEQLTADGYDLQFGTNVLGEISSFFFCVPIHCLVQYDLQPDLLFYLIHAPV